MWQGFQLAPDQASTIAPGVDYLYYFLTLIDVFFSAVIFLTILYFALRYRRRSELERPPEIEGSIPLEVAWTVLPMFILALVFLWGTNLFIQNSRPPAASTEIFVVGKQWMWKLQHPEGVEEINQLHVPVNRPIKLTMTSEDVIHDFSVPAFRIKKDVVPGLYTTEWFQATKTGTFRMYCDQYCGTNHALMRGEVIVMEPTDYEQWLSGGIRGATMAQSGAKLYDELACITCHGTGKGPSLAGIYGKPVKLTNGETVTVDDEYLRHCILYPTDRIVEGYTPIMPTFKGQVSEEQLLQLIAYIKSLTPEEGNPQEGSPQPVKPSSPQTGKPPSPQEGKATK